MRRLFLSAFLLAFITVPAYADLYQWQDEGGVIHITDSMEKVPQKYIGKVKVFKSGTEKEMGATPQAITPQPLEPGRAEDQLYGDYTLEWWRQNFLRKRSEMDSVESTISSKTQFVELFESGRRFGQVYTPEQVDKYNLVKKELPGDIQRLSELKGDYEEFQRRATIAGVPREIREP